MQKANEGNKDNFLYPRSRYYSAVKRENLVFNANLQEFAQKISYIVNLQTGGKLSCEDAYERIETIWKQLELSKKELGMSIELNQHSGRL